jgi:hypothetical protein
MQNISISERGRCSQGTGLDFEDAQTTAVRSERQIQGCRQQMAMAKTPGMSGHKTSASGLSRIRRRPL